MPTPKTKSTGTPSKKKSKPDPSKKPSVSEKQLDAYAKEISQFLSDFISEHEADYVEETSDYGDPELMVWFQFAYPQGGGIRIEFGVEKSLDLPDKFVNELINKAVNALKAARPDIAGAVNLDVGTG